MMRVRFTIVLTISVLLALSVSRHAAAHANDAAATQRKFENGNCSISHRTLFGRYNKIPSIISACAKCNSGHSDRSEESHFISESGDSFCLRWISLYQDDSSQIFSTISDSLRFSDDCFHLALRIDRNYHEELRSMHNLREQGNLGPELFATSSNGESLRWENNFLRQSFFPSRMIFPDTNASPDYNPNETNINWTRLGIIGGALTATVTGLHFYQQNAWWSGERQPFHVVEDPDYAKNIDKAGHFFGGAFSAFIGIKSLQWSGVAEEPSVLIGSAIGALFELYVEFEDGFAKDWGFSPGDAQADVFGALFPVAQYYLPVLRPLQPQFQYFPSKAMRDGTHHGGIFIDDYDGQTYWMAVHVADYMPDSWKTYWPEWLGIAFGVSVRGMHEADALKQYDLIERGFLIALDYDWRKILPGNSWFMQTLKQALNFLHLPSPAIKISPRYIAYGLYF